MFNKKRLLIMTLALLLLVVVTLTACDYVNPGFEFEADDIVDEFIEEGAATMSPTSTPTPTPKKVGFNLTDEQIEGIRNLWPAQNASIDDFGSLYAVYADNEWGNGTSYLTFEYHSEEPVEQLQEDFGTPIFGHPLTETYYTGEWVDEKNAAGEPLQVSVSIGEMDLYNTVYLNFTPDSRHQIVDNIHLDLWPTDWQSNGALTDENTQYIGIGVFPGTNGLELWRTHQLMPAGALPVYRGFEAELADKPHFESIPEEGYNAPLLSFFHDIEGDVSNRAFARIHLYESSDMIQVAFSVRVEF